MSTPTTIRTDDESVVAPTHDDAVVGAWSDGIGGRLGRRALRGASRWTPWAVLVLVTLIVFSAGVAWRAPCAESGWRDDNAYITGCYSDVGRLYVDRNLDQGVFPYAERDDPIGIVEYPVLQGLMMWAPTFIVGTDGDVVQRTQRYYGITVAMLFALALLAVWATMKSTGRRPWDAMIVAAAPSLAVVGTLNWDLLPVALLALAVLAWSRERPWIAGLLIGLGGAAKLYPLLLIGALLLLCLRAGRMRAWLATTIAALATWLVVNLPIYNAYREGWGKFYELSRERPLDFGSIGLGLRYLRVNAVDKIPANTLSIVLLIALMAGIALLVFAAPRRPRLAQVALLVLAAFLFTNKVYSPQYALWLLPFVALARPRWRDVLVWQTGQVIYYFGVWLWLHQFADPNRSLPNETYGLLILLQFATTAWIVALVVRDALQPWCDPVRAHSEGVDDPAGGVLNGAPDRWSLARLRDRRRVVESAA